MMRFSLLFLVLSLVFAACPAPADSWTCPGCGRTNESNFCPDCGAAKPAAAAETTDNEAAKPASAAETQDIRPREYDAFRDEYKGMIAKYAREYGLDPALVAAVIFRESSFRPEVDSAVGARGLMQVTPDAAEWIAEKLGIEGFTFDMMYDPEMNIRFGCWMLNYNYEIFNGDTVCAVAAYHAGIAQVKKWLGDPAVSPDGLAIPAENLPEGRTKTYVQRVLESYRVYREMQ